MTREPNTEWLTPPQTQRLVGTEQIQGTSALVQDFWSWSMSDLRANTVRSLLAEFLVATALQATHGARVEWDFCDIRLADGWRIEVKASAYLQAWEQRALSRPLFGGFMARTWSPREGMAREPSYNADVYVFSLLTAERHDAYDPLDTASWRFWVLPRHVLAATGCVSLSLGRVRSLAKTGLSFEQLADAVTEAIDSERPYQSGEQPAPARPETTMPLDEGAVSMDRDNISYPGLIWIKDPVDRFTGQLTGARPAMRHHEDCSHWWRAPDGSLLGPPPYRASEEQMRTLPPCSTCAQTGPNAARTHRSPGLVGRPCPNCGMTLPLTGRCDTCS